MPSHGKRAMGKIMVRMPGRIRERTAARHIRRLSATCTVDPAMAPGAKIRFSFFGAHRSDAMPVSRGQTLSDPVSCLAAVALAA
jgi:hypothetical protein